MSDVLDSAGAAVLTDSNAGDLGGEKLIPQSKVNELIGAVRKSAAEKARAEALAEFAHVPTQPTKAVEPPVDIKQLVREGIDEHALVQSEAQSLRKTQEQNASLVQQLTSKFEIEAKKHADFEEVVLPLSAAIVEENKGNGSTKASRLILLANQFDNTGELVYELSKNESELEKVLGLLDKGLDIMAQRRLNKFVEGLKTPTTPSPKPLTSIKASPVTTTSQPLTSADRIAAAKKKYRF